MASTRIRLASHPRLYLGVESQRRLLREPALPYLREAARAVSRDAPRYARMPALTYQRDVHNELLLRAREVQTRVVTLLARWTQTGQDRFRRAVIRYVEQMGEWEYWSWTAWRQGNPAPDAIFDLSYGENSATLAIAYDWLCDTLTPEEQALFLGVARARPFCSGLKHARPGGIWWFGKPDTNWNAVCAGGLGMLALAMYEDAPEAPRLLPLCERSIAPFMRILDETDGAWPEGIGYWNYGMRYAFMYLLSHEQATGRRHPLLRRAGARKTLSFPLDFCPHGQPCSFGDVNSWGPLPFHYAAAARLGCADVMQALDTHLAQHGMAPWAWRKSADWPTEAEWLALHPDTRAPAGRTRSIGGVKLYRSLDWAVVADRMPGPRLYVSIRGGTTKVPHGHRDLLSFQCVVGGERLLANVGPIEYLDTTFSPRREELFEIGPTSKNTILINGVGIMPASALDRTEVVKARGVQGIRMEATTAMGIRRDGTGAGFCGRLILLLRRRAFLIVDRIVLPHPGRAEARFHTLAAVRAARLGAILRGERAKLHFACAGSVPLVFRTATVAPTTPTAPAATVLRLCTEKQHTDMTLVTLLSPGSAAVSLRQEAAVIVVAARGRDWKHRVALDRSLRPLRT